MLELMELHRADRYPLESSQDDLMGSVESLGTKETTLKCRFVPLSREDREKYEVVADVDAHKVVFDADPGLSNAKALVWDGKVWRVRCVTNSGGIGRVWVAIVENVPQVELSSP